MRPRRGQIRSDLRESLRQRLSVVFKVLQPVFAVDYHVWLFSSARRRPFSRFSIGRLRGGYSTVTWPLSYGYVAVMLRLIGGYPTVIRRLPMSRCRFFGVDQVASAGSGVSSGLRPHSGCCGPDGPYNSGGLPSGVQNILWSAWSGFFASAREVFPLPWLLTGCNPSETEGVILVSILL